MRSLSYILFFALFLLVSCSSDEDELLVKDELEGLVKLQTLENDTHLVELYTASGLLEEGYNEIFLRIRKQGGLAKMEKEKKIKLSENKYSSK